MITIEDFFSTRVNVRSIEGPLMLPLPTPQFLSMDYDALRIGSTGDATLDELFDKDYVPRDPCFAAAAKMTQPILRAKAQAGYNLAQYCYNLEISEMYGIPCEPVGLHIDGALRLDQCNWVSLGAMSRNERFIHSEVFSPITIETAAIFASCPPENDLLTHYLGVIATLASDEAGNKLDIDQILAASPLSRNVDKEKVKTAIAEAADNLLLRCTRPAHGALVGVDFATLHGLSFRDPLPGETGIKRRRGVLTISQL